MPENSVEIPVDDLVVEPTSRLQIAKQTAWQYVGAAFTEQKNGKTAVSLTRSLAMVAFGILLWKWGTAPAGIDSVPDSLLWTFWGLIGGKTCESLAAIVKKRKGG